MSFPRYPEYKDSGVEWLGEVPGHWEVKPLKRVCNAFPSNVDKKSYEGQAPVRLCNYVDVYYNHEITSDIPFMEATASMDEISRFSLIPGDTIITKDSEAADDIAISAYVPCELPGVVCGYHLTIVRPLGEMSGRYVKRLFDTHFLKAQFAVAANGLTRVGLSQYAIDNALVTVPPPNEQLAIVSFLDRETGKIDALVAEQEKLIALLTEKRQAAISHTVTKGLDPAAPMKDSGIEWLGEVPEHWGVSSLKHYIDMSTSGPRGWSEMTSENGALFFQSQNIGRSMDVLLEDAKRIIPPDDADAERARLHSDDVVVCITGARTGAVAHIPSLSEAAYVNQHVCLLRPSKVNISGRFLSLLLWSTLGQQQLNVAMYGLKQGLGLDQVRNLIVSLPPLSEQTAIVAYLDEQTTKFDALTAEAQRAIELLKEHRAALISAAVTGKIDVRGLVNAGVA
ncbi:MAG: restriction endonuclease subunit S [Rhodospirillaceae bacterium]